MLPQIPTVWHILGENPRPGRDLMMLPPHHEDERKARTVCTGIQWVSFFVLPPDDLHKVSGIGGPRQTWPFLDNREI